MTTMTIYKLTDAAMQTYNGCQWELGVERATSGEGELCGPGWLHCYEDPLLAMLHNPMHGNYDAASMRLFVGKGDGKCKKDGQLKLGFTKMKLVKEIEKPTITLIQRVAYGILCAKEVCTDTAWVAWADSWLSGDDRTPASAAAAREAARDAARDAARAATRDAAWDAAWAAALDAAGAAACDAARAAARAAAGDAAWAAEAACEAAWAKNKKQKINLITIANKAMEVE